MTVFYDKVGRVGRESLQGGLRCNIIFFTGRNSDAS